jgi:hypothetical protein
MSYIQQAKLVLNQTLGRLRNFRFHTQNTDDSVEAQAESLRIWMWASAAGLALIVVTTIVSQGPAADSKNNKSEPEVAMADQIPNGFVLVPIEPTNLDSLDSVFGQHGYADLYHPEGSAKKGRRLAFGVALVRSPRNPRRFAVLIPEAESSRIAELSDPVLVILRKMPGRRAEEHNSKLDAKNGTHAIRKSDLIEEGEPEVITLNENGETI